MNQLAVQRPSAPRSAHSGTVDVASLVSSPEFTRLVEVVRARRDEFQRLRHIPRDVIDLMKAARIFRSSTPGKFGGDALPPHCFLPMVERVSEADGSAGWIAAFGSANTYIAALPEAAQAVIYANGPDQVYAGGLYPLQQAAREPGGWRVSGQWKFASGCMGADWIGVGIAGSDTGAASGGQAANSQVVKMAVCPADEVEIVETWDVMGMQGTGSHDTRVRDKFYADMWTCDRGARGIFDDTIYRYPPLAYQAQVHAAVNLGLARAALDLAAEMSGAAKLMPGAPCLANRAYFRTGLAEGEARLRAARAFYYETAAAAWDVLERGDAVSLDLNNLLRLSASHAARAAAETIQQCYRIVGMAAVSSTHRMQQILRDCLVVTQHAALNDATLENAGAVLAGLPAPAGYP